MHFRRGALLPSALALFAFSAAVEIIDVVSVTPVRAASCPVNTTSGDGDTFNVQIIEAGVGADCTSVSTVPEFPLGLFALFAFALPAVLLVRGRYFSKLASLIFQD